jgi:hypothetical protein
MNKVEEGCAHERSPDTKACQCKTTGRAPQTAVGEEGKPCDPESHDRRGND